VRIKYRELTSIFGVPKSTFFFFQDDLCFDAFSLRQQNQLTSDLPDCHSKSPNASAFWLGGDSCCSCFHWTEKKNEILRDANDLGYRKKVFPFLLFVSLADLY